MGLRRVPASSLAPNPKNWRKHPKEQANALRGILAEVGWVDALLARELPDGTLQLIDGHLRAETTPDEEVPVIVVDLNESEADKVLATFDPLSAMAKTDVEQLDQLLRGIETANPDLSAMLESLAEEAGIIPGEEGEGVRELAVKPPKRMAWVLIGIPIVDYGKIQADMDRLAAMPGVVMETAMSPEQSDAE